MMEPVAWRIKDFADGWFYLESKESAEGHVEMYGSKVQPLVRLSDAEARIEAERLRFEGDLDKWMKTIGAGISGYQAEAYAVMDAACDELVRLRARAEAAEALVKEAGAALEPFVAEAHWWEGYNDEERVVEGFPAYEGELTVGHLRAARAIHHKIGVKDE